MMKKLSACVVVVAMLLLMISCTVKGDENLTSGVGESTVVTEQTTEIPNTTEAPDMTEVPETTEVSETTTEPPEVTTEPPEVTTEPPEVTTEPPEVTTEPPEVTTEPPETTTEAPEETTEAPEETTEEELVGVECLKFTSNGDGTCYVSGVGTCTDSDIIIPAVSPNGYIVTGIGSSAFSGCSNLTSITIPDSVTNIGMWAFSGCSNLASITVDENNEYYKSVDGNLYSKDGKTLIQYAVGKTDISFTISNGVTSIGESAFRGCSSLTSITISDSVKSIGNYAFYGCSSLANVYYIGTKAEWANISIGSNNSRLTGATIVYNYGSEEDDSDGSGSSGGNDWSLGPIPL